MSENRNNARHRKGRSLLAIGVPVVLTAAGALAHGPDLGLPGADRKSVV